MVLGFSGLSKLFSGSHRRVFVRTGEEGIPGEVVFSANRKAQQQLTPVRKL